MLQTRFGGVPSVLLPRHRPRVRYHPLLSAPPTKIQRLEAPNTFTSAPRCPRLVARSTEDALSEAALYPEDLNPVVRQVMNRDVVFLKDTQTVREAIQMFLSSGISGAPVMDQGRHLVGILSETDIIKKEAGVIDALKRASWANNNLNIERLPSDLKKKPKTKLLLDTRIKDVMSLNPISISPDMSIVEAAILMIKSEVNRFPVMEKGKVIGILTRGDILQCMIWEILIAGSSMVDE